MQTAGDLVGIVVEFAASMQNRHDHFRGGATFFWVDIYRDSAPIVVDRHRFVGIYHD
jgi:hypothetical protein